jgi:hypothetical protein
MPMILETNPEFDSIKPRVKFNFEMGAFYGKTFG